MIISSELQLKTSTNSSSKMPPAPSVRAGAAPSSAPICVQAEVTPRSAGTATATPVKVAAAPIAKVENLDDSFSVRYDRFLSVVDHYFRKYSLVGCISSEMGSTKQKEDQR